MEKYQSSNDNAIFYLCLSVIFPVQCKMVLRNTVWCDTPRKKGQHITSHSILDT